MSSIDSPAPVLFLDFDGVLHPDGAQVDQLFCRIPMLEEVLRRYPTVDVVISSSWREVHPLDEIQEYFSPDIGRRVIDITPVRPPLDAIPTGLWSFVREAECAVWMLEHRPLAPWVALDDQPWRFRPFASNLLLIDGRTGLTAKDAERLATALAVITRS